MDQKPYHSRARRLGFGLLGAGLFYLAHAAHPALFSSSPREMKSVVNGETTMFADQALLGLDVDKTDSLEAIFELPSSQDRVGRLSLLFDGLGPEKLSGVKEFYEAHLCYDEHTIEWEKFLLWWGNHEPEEALRYALADFNEDCWTGKHLAAEFMAEAWYLKDPKAFLDVLCHLPHNDIRSALVKTVGQAFAKEDPEAAMAWASGRSCPQFQQCAFLAVTNGILQTGLHADFQPDLILVTAEWLNQHRNRFYASDSIRCLLGHIENYQPQLLVSN